MLVGGVIVAAIAVLWIATRGANQTGKDIGSGAVNLVAGTVQGAGGAIADLANNPDTNPLYGVGSWLGTEIYNATH